MLGPNYLVYKCYDKYNGVQISLVATVVWKVIICYVEMKCIIFKEFSTVVNVYK